MAFSLKAVHSISRPKIVLLYFLFVKRVWYTCIKTTLSIFQLFIFALQLGFPAVIKRLKFMDFGKRVTAN